MNSAIITKIEYRLLEDPDFTILEFILYSGKLSEPIERNRAGNLHKTSINFNKAKITVDNDSLLSSINNRKAQFRITDGNGSIQLVGDDSYPARMTYQKAEDGTAGSFNGYRCSITCNSPYGSSVS